jgi:hypothetical protein
VKTKRKDVDFFQDYFLMKKGNIAIFVIFTAAYKNNYDIYMPDMKKFSKRSNAPSCSRPARPPVNAKKKAAQLFARTGRAGRRQARHVQ